MYNKSPLYVLNRIQDLIQSLSKGGSWLHTPTQTASDALRPLLLGYPLLWIMDAINEEYYLSRREIIDRIIRPTLVGMVSRTLDNAPHSPPYGNLAAAKKCNDYVYITMKLARMPLPDMLQDDFESKKIFVGNVRKVIMHLLLNPPVMPNEVKKYFDASDPKLKRKSPDSEM